MTKFAAFLLAAAALAAPPSAARAQGVDDLKFSKMMLEKHGVTAVYSDYGRGKKWELWTGGQGKPMTYHGALSKGPFDSYDSLAAEAGQTVTDPDHFRMEFADKKTLEEMKRQGLNLETAKLTGPKVKIDFNKRGDDPQRDTRQVSFKHDPKSGETDLTLERRDKTKYRGTFGSEGDFKGQEEKPKPQNKCGPQEPGVQNKCFGAN